jgi:hypothetical protein
VDRQAHDRIAATVEEPSLVARNLAVSVIGTRIDDIWLRFADPRRHGAEVLAYSASGTWREEYVWLTGADTEPLRVRIDDPAVMHCDDRPRPELVHPESWHHFGFEM